MLAEKWLDPTAFRKWNSNNGERGLLLLLLLRLTYVFAVHVRVPRHPTSKKCGIGGR